MVSDEALKKLQEQIAAWPVAQRFVVQQLIEDYLRDREDLRAYEAAGLTPEEIERVINAYGRGQTLRTENALRLEMVRDISTDRLRELAEADRDGRVVVLPVRPVLTPVSSSMLYMIEDGKIYEDVLYEVTIGMSESGMTNAIYTTLSDQMTFEQADIGKTVFFTRKEAEKELEAKRNG